MSYFFETYSEIEAFGEAFVTNATPELLAVFDIGHNVSLSVLGEVALLRECSAAELALIRSEVFVHADVIEDVPALREQPVAAAVSASVDVLWFLA